MCVSLSILASGSRGNCAVLTTPHARILIDAGLSGRELRRRCALAGIGEDAASLPRFDAVLITHEHDDHVSGLARLSGGPAPVYLNQATAQALLAAGTPLPEQRIFQTGIAFAVADVEITPFSVPHDAADPVAFQLRTAGVEIVWVTDLGSITANVKDRMAGADCIVLESNHDLEMLKAGPYPWSLKQRLLSRLGHLSNDVVAEYLRTDFSGQARHVVLTHLSENNNLPELAHLAASAALSSRLFAPTIHVAAQSAPLPTISL